MPFLGDAVTVSLMLLGTCSTIASSTPPSGITSYLGRRRASASVPPTSCSLSVLLMIFPPASMLGCSLRESPRTRPLETRGPRRRHPSALGSFIGTHGAQILFGVLGLEEDPVGHDGRDRLVRALDLELDADLAVLDGHHRKTDILVQSRRVAGRGDLADPLAVLVDREVVDHRAVVVRPEVAAPELDADQLAANALLADLLQRLFADKVLLLRQLHHPLVAVADLVGVGVVPHITAQGQDAALDAPDVARPDRRYPVRLAGLEHPVPELEAVAAGDRKSTRLNSSHANISYAVFCLKKKKHLASPSRHFGPPHPRSISRRPRLPRTPATLARPLPSCRPPPRLPASRHPCASGPDRLD